MANYVSRGFLGALVIACIGLATAPDDANAQGADYQRPEYGKRGVGQGDWIFVPRLLSVFQRPRPDYDPNGLRFGNWLFYPELTVQAAYDDNVFAEENNTKDDFIFTATPAFRLQSDWSVHMLGAEGFVAGEKHVKETDEDAVEGAGTVFGRLDITSEDTLFGSASYRREVDPRTDPENQSSTLTDLNHWIARTGYVHDFARMNLRIDGQAQRYDYLDSADNDRDRNQLNGGARLTYALSPRVSPFVEVGYEDQNFDAAVDDSGVDRDAMTYSAAVGARVLITDLLLGELAVGVEHTEFDDRTLQAFTTPQVAGQLTWNITELTSIILRARQTVDPTTQVGSSSKVITAGEVRVEHELLRNLLVFGTFGYRNDDFKGIGRTDNGYQAGLGGEFLLDQNFSFFAEYDFEHRDSNVPGDDFTRSLVLIGARLGY